MIGFHSGDSIIKKVLLVGQRFDMREKAVVLRLQAAVVCYIFDL